MEYEIREARGEDLPALLALYRPYHQELMEKGMNYSLHEEALPRVLENRIRSRLTLTAVATSLDGSLCGFVFCSILRLSPEYLCAGASSVGFLNDLYVAPSARHQGMAGALAAYAENWLREQGIGVMELNFLTGNDAARDFWEQRGMEPVAVVCKKTL